MVKVSADQYHVTTLHAYFVSWPLPKYWRRSLAFRLGLVYGYYI